MSKGPLLVSEAYIVVIVVVVVVAIRFVVAKANLLVEVVLPQVHRSHGGNTITTLKDFPRFQWKIVLVDNGSSSTTEGRQLSWWFELACSALQ
jgi:hypothetical protein